jgi:hypothetical protein
VGECELVAATSAVFGEATEPHDEFVSLVYEKPGAVRYAGLAFGPSESIHMQVRPLRGKRPGESRDSAERRVASGEWIRQELTVAGRPATVYSGAIYADAGMNGVVVFLPDALIEIAGAVDLQTVLDLLVQLDGGG